MPFFRSLLRSLQTLGVIGFLVPSDSPASGTVVVSVPEQKLYLFDDSGIKIASYPISTSAYGLGDGHGTYSTPLGKLAVASKIGAGSDIGTVFKAGHRTGEICRVNARGRDPIVTRIMHLRGLEKQNARAFDRRIYIHGTPDERNIGKPVSYGCVRMRSRDVIELFDAVEIGTTVEIVDNRVSKGLFAKTVWNPNPAPIASGPAPTEQPAAKIVSAIVPDPTPRKIALSSKTKTAEKPHLDSPVENKRGLGPMTVFEMPGMSFKFGSSTRDEVR